VELDGDSHFTTVGEKHDQLRTATLEQRGLRIVRFTNQDVMQRFEAVCLEMVAVLENQKT
jgi:very-short-patch-repair endonuclease